MSEVAAEESRELAELRVRIPSILLVVAGIVGFIAGMVPGIGGLVGAILVLGYMTSEPDAPWIAAMFAVVSVMSMVLSLPSLSGVYAGIQLRRLRGPTGPLVGCIVLMTWSLAFSVFSLCTIGLFGVLVAALVTPLGVLAGAFGLVACSHADVRAAMDRVRADLHES